MTTSIGLQLAGVIESLKGREVLKVGSPQTYKVIEVEPSDDSLILTLENLETKEQSKADLSEVHPVGEKKKKHAIVFNIINLDGMVTIESPTEEIVYGNVSGMCQTGDGEGLQVNDEKKEPAAMKLCRALTDAIRTYQIETFSAG